MIDFYHHMIYGGRFMKMFKKLMAVVLALIFSLSCVSTVSALSLETDYETLCNEFVFG